MKKASFLMIIISIFFSSAGFVKAGFVVDPDFKSQSWECVENNERGLVVYGDGKEKLDLFLDVDKIESRDLVWIIPIPAEIQDIKAQASTIIPSIKKNYFLEDSIPKLRWKLLASQGYPLLIKSLSGYKSYDIDLKEQIHITEIKDGIEAKIVSADDLDGLFGFFKSKGFNVGYNKIEELKNLDNKKYSLVILWMDSNEKLKQNYVNEFIKKNCNDDEITKRIVSSFLKYDYTSDKGEGGEFEIKRYSLEEKYPNFNNLSILRRDFNNFSDALKDFLSTDEGRQVLGEFKEFCSKNPEIFGHLNQPKSKFKDKKRAVSIVFPAQNTYYPFLQCDNNGLNIHFGIFGGYQPQKQGDAGIIKISNYVTGLGPSNPLLDRNRKIYTEVALGIAENKPEGFFFEKNKSFYFRVLSFFSLYSFEAWIIVQIILSFISGILAGLIAFKSFRRAIKLGFVGIINVLSVVALIISFCMSKKSITLNINRRFIRSFFLIAVTLLIVNIIIAIVVGVLFCVGDTTGLCGIPAMIVLYPAVFFFGPLSLILAFIDFFENAIRKKVKTSEEELNTEDKNVLPYYWSWKDLIFLMSFSIIFIILSIVLTELLKILLVNK